MTRSPQIPGPSPEPHSETNPLGGKIHLTANQEPAHRLWSGYVALVRPCPTCGWENDESSLFCVSCAADIREVLPIASSDSRPGVALVQKRLRNERRHQRRTRAGTSTGGGGWIALGAVILLASVVIGADRSISLLLWTAAVGSALVGIWQIRTDPHAMRISGIFLSAAAAIILLFVGFRAIQATESGDFGDIIALTPTAESTAATTVGTPGPVLRGNVAMYQGGPQHEGQMPGPAPASAPKLAWQMDTGGELYSSPSIANGLLYVMSKSGVLYAVDAGTGATIWQYKVTTYVTRSTPAVIDGVVYVGGGFDFIAVDAATGKEKWSVPLQYGGQASPTVRDDIVVVSSQEGWVYALRTDTGELAWRVPTEGIVFGAAAFSGNEVIYGTDEGILYSVNPSTGTLNWRVMVDGAIYASPVVHEDIIYVNTQAGVLYALDRLTGKDVWSTDRGGTRPPALSENLVVLAARDGGVYGLDAQTGEQRWLFPSGKQSLTAPVISGDLVMFGAGSSLMALETETCKAVWYYLAGDRIESAPVVVGGHVFFGTRDGFLNAVAETD